MKATFWSAPPLAWRRAGSIFPNPADSGQSAVDLSRAITGALQLDRKAAAAFGALHSWDRATDQFVGAIRDAAGSRQSGRSLEPV